MDPANRYTKGRENVYLDEAVNYSAVSEIVIFKKRESEYPTV